ncbi:MAG: aldolase [Pseudomonadota bacterium]|nr:aldolase [Pseudomonadota bacterium]
MTAARGDSNVHGVCLAMAGRAVLLRGPSGSLKSDLALRFLSRFAAEGAVLVADDQVLLRVHDGVILARAPAAIAGKLEVRGIGIVDVPASGEARLVLVAVLGDASEIPRLPPDPPPSARICGVELPLVRLDPREASAPEKLKLALTRRL